MSVSPESTNSVSNSGVMNSMSMTNSVVDTHQETVVQETMMIETTSRKNERENRNKIALVEMQSGSKLTLKDPSFLTKEICTVSLIKIF